MEKETKSYECKQVKQIIVRSKIIGKLYLSHYYREVFYKYYQKDRKKMLSLMKGYVWMSKYQGLSCKASPLGRQCFSETSKFEVTCKLY